MAASEDKIKKIKIEDVGYDPVKEEETDEDEEVGKPISHHHHPPIIKKEETDDEELGSNHPEVYIQAEDTDDEFSEYDLLVNTFRVSDGEPLKV